MNLSHHVKDWDCPLRKRATDDVWCVEARARAGLGSCGGVCETARPGAAVTDAHTVDKFVREQMDFRMGPFELLDLTGLDVSHPVMESIYRQFYDEPRFRPSPITAVRLAGGMLGRKSGSGFYEYGDGTKLATKDVSEPPVGLTEEPAVWVSRQYPDEAQRVLALFDQLNVWVEDGPFPTNDALIIVTTAEIPLFIGSGKRMPSNSIAPL
nr:3-hydroxyacyl-CoA dehydrogenase family protein [Caballeronia sp. dw_19]